MSTIINQGSQDHIFDFKNVARSVSFNKLLRNVLNPGVYNGLTMSISSGTEIILSSGTAIVNCKFNGEDNLAIKANFQSSVALTINQTTPGVNEVVYLDFEFFEVIENWIEIKHDNVNNFIASNLTNAVIIGEITYSGGVITGFDYGRKTWGKHSVVRDWEPNTPYIKDQTVLFQGIHYRALNDHISTTSFAVDLNTFWQQISGASGGTGNEFEEDFASKVNSIDIDGITNTINTNIALNTFSNIQFPKNIKIIIVNRNFASAKVRIAHIDGALGSIANEDYIFYDTLILPKETKEILIPGAAPNDTIMVRSDITSVNFVLTCNMLTTNHKIKRLSALDIDGSLKLINTDYSSFTTALAEFANLVFYVCNRNLSSVCITRIAAIDSTNTIGNSVSPGLDDYILYDHVIVENETQSHDNVINFGNSKTLSFRSDTANVNIIVYGRKTP